MKKLILLVCVFCLFGCVKSGEFKEDRNRMHEMNRDSDVCNELPERCINGITW